MLTNRKLRRLEDEFRRLDEDGLQEDSWSLSGPTFGKDDQLRVIGWSGKRVTNKYYILKCSKCSQDSELFGEGYFRSLKSTLANGNVPCGCGKGIQWSQEQYSILCSRKSKELGHTFLGFVAEWRGIYTKIKRSCEKHGEWDTGTIASLTSSGNGCPGCRTEANTKPADVMITSFLASKAFHPNTKFWRSERKDSRGKAGYWHVSCPECGVIGESKSNHLQNGQRPCDCSQHRQTEAYINLLIDDMDNAAAIKFGISRDSKKRGKQQGYSTSYEVCQHSVYAFPDSSSCKKAERECLQELECSVVLRRDMEDGHTETTWLYNLEKIIEIYERNGGILK